MSPAERASRKLIGLDNMMYEAGLREPAGFVKPLEEQAKGEAPQFVQHLEEQVVVVVLSVIPETARCREMEPESSQTYTVEG